MWPLVRVGELIRGVAFGEGGGAYKRGDLWWGGWLIRGVAFGEGGVAYKKGTTVISS